MTASIHPLFRALITALTDASLIEQVPAQTIDVELVEATEWPDSCLGLPKQGEGCARAITPGYRIELAGGHRYRCDREGKVRSERPRGPGDDNEIWLKYSVVGGIGGWNTVYETDSDRLAFEDEVELRRLIQDSDFFNLERREPDRVIMDRFTRTLVISRGRGLRNTVVRGDGYDPDKDSAALSEFFAWVEARTPPIVRGA